MSNQNVESIRNENKGRIEVLYASFNLYASFYL